MRFQMNNNTIIRRDVYLNRLIVRKHNGLIKIITGIRRCGKSYLLNNLFYEYLINDGVKENHIIKFAFDSAEDLIKIGENPISLDNEFENRKVDPEKFLRWILPQITDNDMYYILLDEVQNLGAFESVLNGFLRKANMDVYVTGAIQNFCPKTLLPSFQGEVMKSTFCRCPFLNIIHLKEETKVKLLMIIRFTVDCLQRTHADR